MIPRSVRSSVCIVVDGGGRVSGGGGGEGGNCPSLDILCPPLGLKY